MWFGGHIARPGLHGLRAPITACLSAVVVWSCTTEEVTSVRVASVEIFPALVNAVEGDRLQLRATVHDETGAEVTAATVTWASSNPAIASVDAAGFLVAHAVGAVHVVATFRDVTGTASVVVLDVAGFGVVESDGVTRVQEAGGQDGFSVVLESPPQADVLLRLSNPDVTEVAVSRGSLTFTPMNWNVSQSVTVTGVDDDEVDGDQVSTIDIAVDRAVSDDAFDDAPDRSVVVVTIDDDVAAPPPPPTSPGLVLVENGGGTRVTELGGSDTFSVRLRTRPWKNVAIAVTSLDLLEVLVTSASLITFTPSNWDVPQTVTVVGVDDLLPDGDRIANVTLAVVSLLSDGAYSGMTESLAVTNQDNELALLP
jgi:hypothetical protein